MIKVLCISQIDIKYKWYTEICIYCLLGSIYYALFPFHLFLQISDLGVFEQKVRKRLFLGH
jgi:hypothetical protein